eukprot:380117-Amorphochlora_amoeboformis.AAC.1
MALTRPQNCAKLGLGGIWGRARVPRYGSRALFLIRNQSTSSDKVWAAIGEFSDLFRLWLHECLERRKTP